MRVKCDPTGVQEACRILSGGGVVIFPTDTVYGIGCNPFDRKAVMKIYTIKNREISKALPILTYSKEIAKEIVVFDNHTERIVEKMWPGPLTVILKIRDDRLKTSLGVKEKIAVRVPNHRCALEMLKQCRYVVGTSANISGAKSTADPDTCEKEITGHDLLLDDGMTVGRGESTIIEVTEGKLKVHRVGEIKTEEILDIL